MPSTPVVPQCVKLRQWHVINNLTGTKNKRRVSRGSMKKIILIILMPLAMAGCATTGSKFTELETAESGESLIYVMRAWRLHRGAATLDVHINDEKVGKLANGGYLPVRVEPGFGSVTISASTLAMFIGWLHDPMSIEYEIAENETKFIMLDSVTNYIIPLGSFYVSGVDIDLLELNETEAMKALPKLRRSY
jgi:hypothetical protein